MTPLDQPRALGHAFVSSKARNGRSFIDGLRQSGALKMVFPRRNDKLEAIIVNTAGGITGGDQFQIEARAGVGTALTLTTQAAERAYRAQAGQTGRLKTSLTASADATLHWLPQETILYEGARLTRDLTVQLASNASFLMVEPVLFGRRAMGEDLNDLEFRDRVSIHRDGTPLYLDGVHLTGDVAKQLDRPAIGGGARAMANLIWVAAGAGGALNHVRELIGLNGGASLIKPDVLVVRFLAQDGFDLRCSLVPVLEHLTQNKLPLSWRL